MLIVILLVIGRLPIELSPESTINLSVAVGGVVAASAVLIVGVVISIFILRYISTWFFTKCSIFYFKMYLLNDQ